MKKYTSLEHTIKKVVAEQNYTNKPVDEAISAVDYDKPKEVPQAFFKPVHIQPRKGEAQIPAGGPTRSRRNVEKEKSSETMHPDLKEEEQKLNEALPLAIPVAAAARSAILASPLLAPYITKGLTNLSKFSRKTFGAAATTAPKTSDVEKPKAETTPVPAAREIDTTDDSIKTQPVTGAAVPTAVQTPGQQAISQAAAPAAGVSAGTSTAAGVAAPSKVDTGVQSIAKAAEASKTEDKKGSRSGRKPRFPGLPSFGSGTDSPTPNSRGGYQVSGTASRAKSRIQFKEETTRDEIEAVARKNAKRTDPVVGRPDSDRSKTMSRHAQIVSKIIEDKKIIIKKEKEENLGKNPLVDTEPKLKHVTLDQGSGK